MENSNFVYQGLVWKLLWVLIAQMIQRFKNLFHVLKYAS